MSTNPAPIQFDNAEFGQGPSAPGGVACAACKRPIVDQYYEAASQVFCGTCAAVLKAGPMGGSRLWRTIQALILGVLGGAISALVWYLFWQFTGYQLGLIAILVGLFVGGGVRKGSHHRGGWYYQAMAMVLTYLAIASAYVPMLIGAANQSVIEGHDKAAKEAKSVLKVAVMRTGRVLLNGSESTIEEVRADLEKFADDGGVVYYFNEENLDGIDPSEAILHFEVAVYDYGLELLRFEDADFSRPLYDTVWNRGQSRETRLELLRMIVEVALVAPVWMDSVDIIGLIIVGIALYEAWKINKKPVLAINGPFMLSPGGAFGHGPIVHVPPPKTPQNPPPTFDDSPQGPTPS